MAESQFVQIAAAHASESFARVYALDEAGRVWEYDFNHPSEVARAGGDPGAHVHALMCA